MDGRLIVPSNDEDRKNVYDALDISRRYSRDWTGVRACKTDKNACYLDQIYQLHGHFINAWPMDRGPVKGFRVRAPWGPNLKDWKVDSGHGDKILLHFQPPPGFEIPPGKQLSPRPDDFESHHPDYCESMLHADSARRWVAKSITPQCASSSRQSTDGNNESTYMLYGNAVPVEAFPPPPKVDTTATKFPIDSNTMTHADKELVRMNQAGKMLQAVNPDKVHLKMNHAKEEMVRMKQAGRPWEDICAMWLEATGKTLDPTTASGQ
ncbi:MAG: hypothetical protein Q9222_002736 [Ikaeria aurantiellina]